MQAMGQRSLSSRNNTANVVRLTDLGSKPVRDLLGQLGMQLVPVDLGESIPGSFWGDEEAGLIENRLYARADSPIHSILHEACHWLCMDDDRRRGLHTNAGGDYDEENAVCYLQILLADRLSGFGRARCMADMDAWGYSFRLGSTQAWFEHDADDAKAWLEHRNVLSEFH
jgi:hypothetical protein